MDKNSLIFVTGGAGFIGANLVRHLNEAGYKQIQIIDSFQNLAKFKNVRGLDFLFADKEDFKQDILFFPQDPEEVGMPLNGPTPDMVFHLGAISSTTHKDGRQLMSENFEFSRDLIFYCLARGIPIQYASSAAVYGNETEGREWPLNGYAFTKWMVDQYAREWLSGEEVKSPLLGLRYFNVYGPGEAHKGKQSSVIYHWYHQAMNHKKIAVFEDYAARDFIHVDDVCKIHLWLMDNPTSGIIDVGTGRKVSFDKLAEIVKEWFYSVKDMDIEIEHVPMPEELKEQYQYDTCADGSLKFMGYPEPLLTVEQGVVSYLNELSMTESQRREIRREKK